MADSVSTKQSLSAAAAFSGLKLAAETVTQLQTIASEASVARPAPAIGLLVGATGTGAAASVRAIAASLGRSVVRVDLGAIVSKYIGETEKNLDKIFAAADPSNSILFFDEADALFGKRTEVKDAHDRYANIEVAYLLQRMESFAGLSIIATKGEVSPLLKDRIRYTVRLVPDPFPVRK